MPSLAATLSTVALASTAIVSAAPIDEQNAGNRVVAVNADVPLLVDSTKGLDTILELPNIDDKSKFVTVDLTPSPNLAARRGGDGGKGGNGNGK